MAYDPSLVAAGAAGGADAFCENVELRVSCNSLIKKDSDSESDPFVIIYLSDRRTGHTFKEIGRSATLTDTPHPEWPEAFKMGYYFEEEQELRFDVYDEDDKGKKTRKLTDHDFLGSATMTLGSIVHASGGTVAKKLLHAGKTLKNKKTKRLSTVKVIAEQAGGGAKTTYRCRISASKLPRMDTFGGCDPFFEIRRQNSASSADSTMVHRSEVIKKSKDPKWQMFSISSHDVCMGDPSRSVIFDVFDWDADGSSDVIGRVTVSFAEFEKGFSKTIMKIGKTKSRGTLTVVTEQMPSFLDYMAGGLDLNMIMAIDYTGSNGNPATPGTLHHLGTPIGSVISPYQMAIRTIGNIVSVYDTDQMYPVFGFGAKIDGTLYHDFAVNFNPTAPEVPGILGVEQAYVQSITRVMLYGPTFASPILQKARVIAQESEAERKKGGKLQYNTLLIMTDGAWMDLPTAVDIIVAIANEYLPLSIIIVGIANLPRSPAEAAAQEKEWSGMKLLDADEGALRSSKGTYAKRDVVQFVKLTDYLVHGGGFRYEDLSRDTLQELPTQFMSYVEYHKIAPPPKSRVAADFGTEFALTDEMLAAAEKEAALGAMPAGGVAMFAGPAPPLPIGWEKQVDAGTGAPFYVHSSGAVQWEHPGLAR